MARYIDVEKIKLNTNTMVDDSGEVYVALSDVRKAIALAPTADVAPRAEVAREIIEDVATLIEAHWSEIQHGVYWLVCGRCIPLRELLKTVEKKYTEGQK